MKVINDKKTELEIEVDEIAIAEIIVHKLNQKKSVQFAGYKQVHPSKNECIIYIKAKEPKKELKLAIEEIEKDVNEVLKQIKKA